jgi:hypothetical protein
MTILVRDADHGWREPRNMGYESEATLQEIIYAHPTLIPGVSGEAVACREFQSSVGPADVVIVDSQGNLTLVECKLAGNPQVRREVVGQVLDYASRLWRMPVDEFERTWSRAEPKNPALFDALSDDEGRARAALQENLNAGRFNLVLAVDQLNDGLKRIVEFLNAITAPSTGVIVIEFTRARENDVEILIPQSYGAELVEAKSASSAASKHSWTIDEFLEWCEQNDPDGLPQVRAIIASMQANGFDVLGGSAKTPSLNCGLDVPGMGRKYPICMYSHETRGALVEVRFPDFRKTPGLQERLAQFVESIPGVPIPVQLVRDVDFKKRPNVSARDFSIDTISRLAAEVSRALLSQE